MEQILLIVLLSLQKTHKQKVSFLIDSIHTYFPFSTFHYQELS
jgi:hypothetical protein